MRSIVNLSSWPMFNVFQNIPVVPILNNHSFINSLKLPKTLDPAAAVKILSQYLETADLDGEKQTLN